MRLLLSDYRVLERFFQKAKTFHRLQNFNNSKISSTFFIHGYQIVYTASQNLWVDVPCPLPPDSDSKCLHEPTNNTSRVSWSLTFTSPDVDWDSQNFSNIIWPQNIPIIAQNCSFQTCVYEIRLFVVHCTLVGMIVVYVPFRLILFTISFCKLIFSWFAFPVIFQLNWRITVISIEVKSRFCTI